jgi:hypothetical protein
MCGLGPGYEQCIHITAAEILRWFIGENADASDLRSVLGQRGVVALRGKPGRGRGWGRNLPPPPARTQYVRARARVLVIA